MRKPFWSDATATLYLGEPAEIIRELPTGSVDCVIVSPDGIDSGPWDGEPGYNQRVRSLRHLLAELRRVLAADGTVWLHLPDAHDMAAIVDAGRRSPSGRTAPPGYRASGYNCRGMPRRITAMCPTGWTVLGGIYWDRSGEMPGPVRCRTVDCYETIFLLAKQRRSFRTALPSGKPARSSGIGCRFWRAPCRSTRRSWSGRCGYQNLRFAVACHGKRGGKVRSVAIQRRRPMFADIWVSLPARFRRPRFDVLPVAIAARCIAAGCREGGTVLDVYAGGGTAGVAARRLGRNYIGIDTRPDYLAVAARRQCAASREGGAA